jgi:hypothetical protein
VPDRRTHRGPHPEDARLFAPEMCAKLSLAVSDLCWLLSKNYAPNSSLKLVGDRYNLVTRQRVAIARCSCSDADADRRRQHEIPSKTLFNRRLILDGYNIITTIEAALAGGVVLVARDGAYRDMASMHGSYRKVVETLPALELLGSTLSELHIAECIWYLDRPVSNSGRLKNMMEVLAFQKEWPWKIELVPNPDVLLTGSSEFIATADSIILDQCSAWHNLTRTIITKDIRNAWIVDLSS